VRPRSASRQPLTLAFVTAYAASDPAGWSGIAVHMSQALEAAGIVLEYVGSLGEPWPALATAKHRFYRLAGKRYMRDRDPRIVRAYAQQVANQLAALSVNAILSPGTIPIANLDCAAPIIVWTDATFSGLVDFYPEYTDLCRETKRGGDAAEQAALDRCALAIYTSDWAAQTAIERYGADPARVRVVPFGANLAADPSEPEVASAIPVRRHDECQLLFLGRDWARKGGPMAVAVTHALNTRGMRTRLVIIGCTPPLDAASRAYCEVVGPLDTASAQGSVRLVEKLRGSHFLILPTLADCTPVAVAEANAFGVPCLATAVGGLPTIVREGFNGKLFPTEARPEDWSQFITGTVASRESYESLALASYAEYHARLNWRSATEKVQSLIEGVLA
jgi:glycosyltransferase involved in cell wall biosynthesis